MVEENRFKEKWAKKIRQVSNFRVVKCKTKKWLSPKGNGFSSRARTRYCIQSFWSQTVPVGGWWRSPLCIIQLSNTNTPHCEVFGTILFFFFQPLHDSWVVHPPLPPSILRHPPSAPPCFCISGPVPISKPWGVDSSMDEYWGLCVSPDDGFFLFLRRRRCWEGVDVWRTGEHPLKECLSRTPRHLGRW